MQRDVIVNGWLFGIDPEQPTRVRFARPFTRADKYDFLDPQCGAITGLERVIDANEEILRIECGSTRFLVLGNSAYNFQLHREATA